jgi:hypothetical protein
MQISTLKTIGHHYREGAGSDDVCPSLILADKVVCDAFERNYEPCSRQVREFCANREHVNCSLRHRA